MSRRILSHCLSLPGAFLLVGLSLIVAGPTVAQAPGVTEESFTAEVIEASKHTAVFVNLYAVWCRPCRPLFQKLETAAAGQDGRVKLVSLDIDSNPRTVEAILMMLDQQDIKRPPNMQIPAVVAFRDGKPMGLMIGAHYDIEALREFFDKNTGS
ncbi:thioredoxin family protein [Methyloceanibacter caenitepidi]|uniref:Thioredoxin domain-containing protein EC-YbbN n=1 Tax=Methyloceanibacter caenitepidi TaxID=1384459 RepID=A0A0A8JZL2_9HYPH|nr:thioredoxin domain-containing protein [Methyloceanibacter caenitepidi]BAQ15782.1 thioredoxin domain-containing protein EC-YbbN [Methyloceanibacter caenitepidi]